MRLVSAMVLAITALLLLPAHVAGSIVVNGGFETCDLTGWRQEGQDAPGLVGTTDWAAHSGDCGLADGSTGLPLSYIFQHLPTVPGGVYTLDYWLANNTAAYDDLHNEFEVSWDNVAIPGAGFSDVADFEWIEYNFTGLVATSASTVLEFGFRQDESFLVLDDVTVDQTGLNTPEPSMGWLAGLASIAILKRVRSRTPNC